MDMRNVVNGKMLSEWTAEDWQQEIENSRCVCVESGSDVCWHCFCESNL